MAILDVDLIGYERGDADRRRAIVDGVMRSLTTGFVYLAHDLPEDELDETYALLERFFALPPEAKARVAAPGSRGQRGYTGLGVETAAGRTTPDWKEMLNWGEAAPRGHPLGERFPGRYGEPVLPEAELPGSHDRLMGFHRRLARLQRRFLRIVAEGLGAHPTLFDPMVEHGATLTRAIHYPPMAEAPGAPPMAEAPGAPPMAEPPNAPPTEQAPRPAAAEPPVWAAEHGDINLVTALPRATATGLEVRTDAGWIDAAPPPGHAIVNTGLMLEHLSNGLIPTGIHRVVAPPDAVGGRLSVVQFCHPTPSTILSPLASCITPDHPQRFGAISAADRLDEVLWQIGLSGEPGAATDSGDSTR